MVRLHAIANPHLEAREGGRVQPGRFLRRARSPRKMDGRDATCAVFYRVQDVVRVVATCEPPHPKSVQFVITAELIV